MDIRRLIQRFAGDRSGATAIEYALIALVMSLAIVASLPAVTPAIVEMFDAVVAGLDPSAAEPET